MKSLQLNALFTVPCLFSFCFFLSSCQTTDPALSVSIANSRSSFTNHHSRQIAKDSQRRISELKKDYRVGSGDVLEISIFEWELRGETKTARFVVSETGNITMPVIEDVRVGGHPVGTVKRRIEQALKDGGFILQPRVSVDIIEYRSRRVSVVGAVHEPGAYTLRKNVTTLMDILSLAGGVTSDAGLVLNVIRKKELQNSGVVIDVDKDNKTATLTTSRDKSGVEVITIDLFEFLELGDGDLNMIIESGDHIHVPLAKTYSVLGFVGEAGSFPLNQPTTVLQAIATARGIESNEASPRHCILKRQTKNGEVAIPLDIAAIKNGKAPNIYLQPNDIIEVRQTPAKKAANTMLDVVPRIFSFGYRLDNR